MKSTLCLAFLAVFGLAGLVGCEASARVDTDTDHGSYHKETVKRESPSGDTVYERKTETKTEIH